jgi:hypothetical protein
MSLANGFVSNLKLFTLSENRYSRCQQIETPISESDVPIFRDTCGLDFSTFYPSIGISELAGSRVLMSMDSGLTFSRSPIQMPPVLHQHLWSHTATSPSGYRVSRIQPASVLCRREPRFSEPRLLGFLDTCPHDQRL